MMNGSPRNIEFGPPPGPGPRKFDFGLVIGVDHYAGNELRGAVQDAEQFHDWLRLETGGGVAEEHARIVRSTLGAAAADDAHALLKREVDANLEHLLNTADALHGGRRLYFHFSGHGHGSTMENLALLLASWSAMLAHALSSWKYRGYLDGIGLFEELVVSLDCCRSDGRALGYPPEIKFERRSERVGTRAFVAHATEARSWSFESAEDGRWQGVFTRRLLKVLRSAERGISAIDLKRALEFPTMHSGQQAHVDNGLKETSWFGRRGTRPLLVVAFTRARGHVVLRGGSRRIVAEHDVEIGPDGTPAPWSLAVDPDLYKLEAGAEYVTFDHDGEAVLHVDF